MKIIKKTVSFLLFLIFIFSCNNDKQNYEKSMYITSVDSLVSNCLKQISVNKELAELYAEQIYKISKENNYQEGIAEYYYLSGKISFYDDNYQKAVVFYDSARIHFEKIENNKKLSDVYFSLSRANAFMANFDEAILYCNKSMQLRQELNDLIGVSDCYVFLGEIHKACNNIEKAFYYLNKALEKKNEIDDQLGLSSVYRALGKAFEVTNEIDKAYDCYVKAYEIDSKYANLRKIAICKHYLGKINVKRQRFDDAKIKFEESLNVFVKLNEKYGQIKVLISIAELYEAQNNIQISKKYLLKSFVIADSIDNKQLKKNISKKLAELYKKIGKTDSAYYYLEKYSVIFGEIFSFEREKLAQEMENKFQLLTKNQEIEILKETNKRQKQQRIIFLLAIAIGFLLVIAVLSVFIMRAKTLKQRNVILNKEKEVKIQQQKVLKEKLDNQNKELTSKSMFLIRNNEALEAIIQKLKTIEKYMSSEHKNKFKSIIRDIEATTKQNLWKEFETAFNNVHTEFFDALLEICPNLSPVEIKIAAFLRLNLSTKEIAAITYKSESSIKTTRYRLRKKLDLPSEKNLTTYLLKL